MISAHQVLLDAIDYSLGAAETHGMLTTYVASGDYQAKLHIATLQIWASIADSLYRIAERLDAADALVCRPYAVP